MTRILRLLLIVAIALPMWQPAVAQNVIPDKPVQAEVNTSIRDMVTLKTKVGAKPYEAIIPRGTVPEGYARVTLAVSTAWVDNNNTRYGYQMLLDPDAAIYSQVSGYATVNATSGSGLQYGTTATRIYNACEYKIPENADATSGTQNMILEQASIEIPAGTYDYAIDLPGANYILFASNRGDTQGRAHNFEFKSGASYVFNVVTVTENGNLYDAVYLEMSQPYMAMLNGDGAFGNVKIGEAATTTITVMNTGEESFTPVITCDNPAFTITSPSDEPLTSGASRNYVVTFVPTAIQSYNGTFTLTAAEQEAAFDINYTTQLSGNGIGEQGDPSGGNNSNQMYPIYTNQARFGTKSQMIYPATMLETLGIKNGDIINSLTFYVRNNGTVNTDIRRFNVALSLGETTVTTITSEDAMTSNRNGCTPVFSGTLTGGQNTLTVKLTTPFQYHGGNLIVDFVSDINNNDYNFNTNWAGENNHSNASYCTYVTRSGNGWTGYNYTTNTSQGSFLPEISIGYIALSDLAATTSLDFETVKVGFGKSKTVLVKNESSSSIQANLSISPNPPFSVANSTITIGANSFAIIPVTFMPNAEGNFNGTLTVVAGSETTTISLTGKGILTGPETILDPSYYDDENNGYTWPLENVTVDNVTTEADSKFSKLNEIATDPDQIIALLRKVYMDRNIPGNYYRGYTSTGGEDHDNVVPYTGVGRITSSTATECENSYGWKIPGTVKNGDSYRYLDPEQYKPYKEGVTLLLIEMQDKFKKSDVFPSDATNSEHNYTNLRKYIGAAIKSARIVTEARRSGEGMERGTMFKIDCDHMNKFYLIAKGQLLWFDNQKYEANNANIGYQNPVYYNSTYYDHNLEKSYLNGPALLCHMYEQFSPVQGGAEAGMNDIYRLLVTDMESFGVVHDCPNVPYVQNGHHSMMYGEDSESHDCQDVRDMMFFVPDYRMTDHFNRGSGGYLSEYRTQDYFRYNTKRQPTIGMFVIKQFEIPEGSKDLTYTKDAYDEITEDEDGNEITIHHEAVTGLYQHKLSWKSNLDDFLPSYMQEYELWEIVVDDFGIEKYQPVYYRNASGAYTDAQGATVTTPVPIILQRKDLTEFEYTDVFVDMHEGSQTKTYVIRGRDAADAEGKHFMSLQMSNPEETIIPGTDPREKARMISATYYSRYNPDNEMNCYSNKLELTNNGITLTEDELVGKTIQFCRSSRAAQVDEVTGEVKTDAQGNILYEETANDVVFATATASATQNITIGTGNNSVRIPSGTITVTIANGTQGSKDDYPVGKSDENTTGYHPNENLSFTYTLDENDYVRFYTVVNNKVQYTSIGFWDNFTVEVDKNAHPFQYLYRMEIKASATATDPDAYTNNARVPVYKTDSQINSYTLNQVNADVDGDLTLEDSEFDVKVQYSSKGGILRYDSYRWKSTEARYIVDEVENNGDDEEEIAPTGQAGNQVEYYTVNMNKDNEPDYYVADQEHQPKVTATNPTAWATFVDYHLRMNPDNQEYVYAPVVELFTNGYKQYLDENDKLIKRTDYNTYGGPMKKYANGKLEVETVVPKDANGNNAVMTDYSWLGTDGNEYAYYTLNLNLKTRQVPESYQFYKVRAWHQVLDMNNNPKPEYLDEQYEALNYRKGNAQGKYKFEEITYPACNADASLGTWDPTELGAEQDPKSVGFTDDNGKPLNFTAGTFGARKIGVGNTEDFKIRYYVRIYFTLEDNMPSTTTNTTGVHIKDETADNSGGVFYIVEGYTDYVVNTSIPTSIKVFDSREVVGVKYYNVAGIESDTPFQGVNIVVTRYNDGSTTTTKIIK